MKAVGYSVKGPLDRENALVDLEIEKPEASGYDLLVEIRAIGVNPVDAKIRSWMSAPDGEHRVLGWDGCGVVVAMGERAEDFAIGDRVYYAGELDRQGTNAEYNLVDSRIAARAPANLSDAEAAALPLTTLTAFEMLFDRIEVTRPVPGAAPAIVVIGAAGGVGSIAIQLLRAKTDLQIIATASRPQTREWCLSLGAHHVIDHSKPLAGQVEALGIGAPGFVFSTAGSAQNRDEAIALLAAQGRYGFIDDQESFDVMPFKGKSISVHMESMFTRSLMKTADIERQGAILRETAELAEEGRLRSTLAETLGRIDAASVIDAHRRIETGRTRGKIVLQGYASAGGR